MRRQTNKNIRSILPVALLVLVTAGVTGCGGGSGGTLGGGFSGVAVSAANVAKGATLQQSLTSSQVADLQISGLPADTLVTLSLANATSQADSPITTRSNGAGVAVFPRVSFADGKKFRIQTADNAVDFFLQISVSGSAGGVVLVSVATPPVNHVPVARIGAVQNASVGAPVSLAGSQSSDPDNDALSFIWAQSSGPAQVTLTGAGTATASFTPAVAGGYSFRLTVSDGKGGIAFADVTVTVSAASSTLGSLSGKITDSKTALNPIAGVLVNIEGTSKTATTGSDGKFSFSNVPPGSVFVTATPPTGTYLPGETRDAVYVGAGAAVTGVNIVLSARQGDSATYIGLNGTNGGVGCATCHANKVASFTNSAHYRSLSSGFSRLINPILTTGPRAGKHMWPEVGEVLDSGVKANNPAYDPNDTGVPASLATTKVYLCQPITGTWAMKFGGSATTIADADRNTFPLVHIDFVYGGEGDRDSRGAKPNYGVFKQRYQGSLADCKVADLWTYTSTADKARDTLTLPVQIAQSGDTLKFAGYHPAEATFPHESWTERSRTFSHACAGCHNTGMTIDWDIQQFTYAVADPEGSKAANQAAIKTYNYIDQNITCEQCHGPGSEHADAGGGKGVSIINPAYLTAEGERQVCAKCHAFDDGQNAKPAQDYGFEFPWNSDNAAKLGGGNFIGGVYNIADYLGNWEERLHDEEALWNPEKTKGKLYGQAHRQQYLMLSYSKHTNNPYRKLACTSCHSPHSLYQGSAQTKTAAGDNYSFSTAPYTNNVLCLGCHAGYGPFAELNQDKVAAVHTGNGGKASKNGTAITTPSSEIVQEAKDAFAEVVTKHMTEKCGMSNAIYNPTDDNLPVGRCTSCHMPKLAKSGAYSTGPDFYGNQALVEGDQGSHVFDIVWPYESTATTQGGPVDPKYSTIYTRPDGVARSYKGVGYMPNSCSKCHAGARQASIPVTAY